jgi:hypothetical protein
MAKTPTTKTKRASIRLGSTFTMTAVPLVITPVFGPAIQLRGPRPPWSGPEFNSFPLYRVDMGTLNYAGIQEVTLGAPTLRSP